MKLRQALGASSQRCCSFHYYYTARFPMPLLLVLPYWSLKLPQTQKQKGVRGAKDNNGPDENTNVSNGFCVRNVLPSSFVLRNIRSITLFCRSSDNSFQLLPDENGGKVFLNNSTWNTLIRSQKFSGICLIVCPSAVVEWNGSICCLSWWTSEVFQFSWQVQ